MQHACKSLRFDKDNVWVKKDELIQYRDEDLSYFENMSGPDSEKIKKTYLKSSKTMN